MQLTQSSALLRRALQFDAIVSGTTGLLLSGGAAMLSNLLGLSTALMQTAGLTLLPFAALVLYVGMRREISRPAVWLIIVINAVWVIGSIALMLTHTPPLSMLGYGFVALQASVVALFAALEFVGLRRLS